MEVQISALPRTQVCVCVWRILTSWDMGVNHHIQSRNSSFPFYLENLVSKSADKPSEVEPGCLASHPSMGPLPYYTATTFNY